MISDAEAAFEIIQSQGAVDQVEVAIVLGTGLGNMAEAVEAPISIPYTDLPGFPKLTISGHDGRLVIGKLEGTNVAILQGRSHYYENGDSRAMASAIETLAMLGAHTLILTASAGSVKPDFYPGTLMLVVDHINFNGLNPLIGVASDGGFVSMTEAYDARLIKRMKRAVLRAGVTLHEGVYMWFAGPSFETPAEIKMARALGADAVGMSIVPEVILARRLGVRVAAIAMLTNFGAGFQGGNPTHAQTREAAAQGAIGLRRLLRAFLRTKEDAWGVAKEP
jgi:purine-nucleoside phosphorylase